MIKKIKICEVGRFDFEEICEGEHFEFEEICGGCYEFEEICEGEHFEFDNTFLLKSGSSKNYNMEYLFEDLLDFKDDFNQESNVGNKQAVLDEESLIYDLHSLKILQEKLTGLI
ncbi:22350_t:CDS:2 [Gigaspora margarita]|uniref:22350_t:CDS:1 n=1 Tax=Gigaspora margarita TaxID=4874 RepID=A0ABN7UPB6_GIGMA|nr:22350_t:CDS:2 [Gigaspora margarita]